MSFIPLVKNLYRHFSILKKVKKKSPHCCEDSFKIGIDILSRALGQVPSALAGLTSLFGMGRGDPRRNRRHKGINRLQIGRFQIGRLNLQFDNLLICNYCNNNIEKRHKSS